MKRNIALAGAMLASVLLFCAAGCQSTIAGLTATLGNASAQIAQLEGNTPLAAQIATDTAQAVKQINAWKSGSPAHNAVEALGVVETDLSLICPSNASGWQASCAQYAPLIQLALGTAQTIILLIDPTTALKTQKVNMGGSTPTNSQEFTRQWNGIANSIPSLRTAVIK